MSSPLTRSYTKTSEPYDGCPNQEIGVSFLFKGLTIEICPYYGEDPAPLKKMTETGEIMFF
jgi:hypothetical protein